MFQIKQSSDDGKEDTPVPIPNTEVKLFSADGSWGLPPARVGRRQAQKVITDRKSVVAFFYCPQLPKTEGQLGAIQKQEPKSETANQLEADEKHGDQEDQGSEAARSGAYLVREHRTAEADESSRSTCFGVSADGSWGAPCESRTLFQVKSILIKTDSLFILNNEAELN